MIQINKAHVTFYSITKNGDRNATKNATKDTNRPAINTPNVSPTPLFFQLNIDKGEKVAIIGESGAGKSTLLNLIAGFVCIDNNIESKGSIILDGVEHTNSKPYQRPVSMLFQNNNLFNHLTVADNIGLGLKPNLKLTVSDKQQIKKIASQVGLADMLERKPDKLSGGQQQRVALARCLLRDKPILLLDEPFSALDKALRVEMLNLLLQLVDEKQLTLVIVTHQPEELEDLVDTVIDINTGTIREVVV